MSEFLRRNLAPLSDEAWRAIESEATRVLKGNLSARTFVDVQGPLGWDCGARSLGRVEIREPHGKSGINWGVRQVLPLVEVRVPFVLGMWEMDNLGRGGVDPDLKPVADAAQKAAAFEERIVYQGLPEAAMDGILNGATKSAKLAPATASAVEAVGKAVLSLQCNGIGGPYDLVLATEPYAALAAAHEQGNALRPRVLDLLEGGKIRWSPSLPWGAVVSRRGGDFELSLGQDFSVGYEYTDGDDIHLFLTETLAFRVMEPNAAAVLSKGTAG